MDCTINVCKDFIKRATTFEALDEVEADKMSMHVDSHVNSPPSWLAFPLSAYPLDWAATVPANSIGNQLTCQLTNGLLQ